jgi:hypothetical protein
VIDAKKRPFFAKPPKSAPIERPIFGECEKVGLDTTANRRPNVLYHPTPAAKQR